MTSEEWNKVEQTLLSPFSSVKLKIDGYNVSVTCMPEKPLHYCMHVFIDGKFKYKWLMEDCDIRRRFCQQHTKSLLNAKENKQLKRKSKYIRDEVKKNMSCKYYLPLWRSFRLMKSHFIKNNDSIELIEVLS